MGEYKKTKVDKFAWSDKHKCYVVLLNRNDGTQFAVRDYRMGETYVKDEVHAFPNCEKIENLVLKSGVSIDQYSNVQKTNDGPTYVPVDGPPTKELPTIIPLEDKTDLILTTLIQILSYHQQSEPVATLKSVFQYRDELFGLNK